MRSIDSTRPALSLVTSTDRPPAAAVRTCRCGWAAVRPAADPAELEWATHQVQDHATDPERARIGAAVMALQEEFAAIGTDLPGHLLPLVVRRVMGGMAAGVVGVAA